MATKLFRVKSEKGINSTLVHKGKAQVDTWNIYNGGCSRCYISFYDTDIKPDVTMIPMFTVPLQGYDRDYWCGNNTSIEVSKGLGYIVTARSHDDDQTPIADEQLHGFITLVV